MDAYVSWVQLSITAILFAVVIWSVRSMISSVKEHLDRELRIMSEKVIANDKALKETSTKHENGFLHTSWAEQHKLVHENEEYRLREHISESLNAIFKEIRALSTKIEKLDLIIEKWPRVQ